MVAYCNSETEWVVGILATLSLTVISIPVFTRKDYSLFEPLTFVLLLIAFGTTLKHFTSSRNRQAIIMLCVDYSSFSRSTRWSLGCLSSPLAGSFLWLVIAFQ